MSFSCYCIATCDLREDRPNSSDFDLLSTDLVNRGSGGEIVRVEGRFRAASGYYQLDLTLQTSLGERKYKADSSMADPDQTGALLWVRGGRIEAISINDTREPLGNERSWKAPDVDLCLMNILNADRT